MDEYKKAVEQGFHHLFADALDTEKQAEAGMEWFPVELALAMLCSAAAKLGQHLVAAKQYDTLADALMAFGLNEDMARRFAAKIEEHKNHNADPSD